jgi:thiamine biosynthesis lipoprotein
MQKIASTSFLILDGYKKLGTSFWVELFLGEKEEITLDKEKITKIITTLIDTFDDTYSRFKDTSLLSDLNNKKTVPYDYDLVTMLQKGIEVEKETDGVFSLFIKEKLEQKGYGHAQPSKNSTQETQPKSSVIISSSSITLTGNKGIDLGGIGKGYLIDLIGAKLKELGLHYFLINGGGDIYVTSNKESPVTIFLEHPKNNNEYLGKIALKNQAFCSSSSYKRKWLNNGKEVNHFIAEKEIWAASYVICDTTTKADIYATVFCILAHDKTKIDTLSLRNNLEYVVIDDAENAYISRGFPDFIT